MRVLSSAREASNCASAIGTPEGVLARCELIGPKSYTSGRTGLSGKGRLPQAPSVRATATEDRRQAQRVRAWVMAWLQKAAAV